VKLRIGTIAASVAVSALLLFGGWYAYQHWVVESPFEKTVKQFDGVNSVESDINRKQVALKLDLKPGTNLGELVKYINNDGKKWVGQRELSFEIKDQSNSDLNRAWNKVLFSIAQAMENKQYTNITTALDQLQQQDKSITAKAEMDDKNVYITLTDGKASKFIILPRIPERMGAWPNA
jgi:hypothetical protein